MVKVLCKGGPWYWIKEPLTELEKRIEAADRAEHVREKGILHSVPKVAELHKQWLANDPVPPVTPKERAQYRREYPDQYFLLPAEIYPWDDDVDGPHPLEVALNNMTHMTFYGAFPHRPLKK
jgi:hypothetical protein